MNPKKNWVQKASSLQDFPRADGRNQHEAWGRAAEIVSPVDPPKTSVVSPSSFCHILENITTSQDFSLRREITRNQ